MENLAKYYNKFYKKKNSEVKLLAGSPKQKCLTHKRYMVDNYEYFLNLDLVFGKKPKKFFLNQFLRSQSSEDTEFFIDTF
ncbi:hypothetical protein HCUR_01281 [Holospora curviuscula]|uniref:Uncharacterized protein n=1 Tax=Holospora curviuscula TaxID=1082868 RepID=A0A2S5R7I5_9PROT|nr:hypothetical protein HCUR_01281 [Holospora curviuscula]